MEEKELVERLTKVEVRSKNNESDIEGLQKTTQDIHNMQVAMNGILIEIQHMREDYNKSDTRLNDDITEIKGEVSILNDKITTLENVPTCEKAKKWDEVKWQIFMFILLGIVAYVCGVALPFFK